MKRFAMYLVLLGFTFSTITGCGGDGGEPLPPTAEVSGVVTQNGEPVADANVAFVMEGKGFAARAVTDATGKYTIPAYIGKNKVAVFKTETFKTGEKMMESQTDDDGNTTEVEVEIEDTKQLLPSMYASANTSPLTVVVKEGANDPFDIQLSN